MPTTDEQTTSDLPAWAKTYVTDMLTSARQLGQRPYQPYGGQRFVGYTPLETKAYTGLMSLAPATQMDTASGLAGAAGSRAGMAGQDYARQATSPYAMGAYMSPYMQNVVEQQKRGALQDYSRQIPSLQSQGIRAGARGGTREALLQSEAQRNLQQQLQGIQATGSQQAFQNAQQAQQFGADLGLRGSQAQMGAAQVLGGLGQQQFNQRLGALQAQQMGGTQMRGIEQQRLDAQYQDYLAQQAYPQQQLKFMGDILRGGTPTTQSTSSSTYTPPPNPMNQIAPLLAMYLANKYF